MQAYAAFLGAMSFLFVGSAVVLLALSVVHFLRRHQRKAAIYLALTLLAGTVAAGFHFFRALMTS